MAETESVTQLLIRLDQGDALASKEIWDRFICRLVGLARARLKNIDRRAVDEEDVALSAFNAFFQGVEDKRFERLENREDLWQVLAMLAERKAIAVLRRELADKRGGGANRGESVFEEMLADSSAARGIDRIAGPSADVLDGFTNDVREMLESLGDQVLERVAMLKLQAFTNKEIAIELRISARAVERKLSLIREKWEIHLVKLPPG